MSTPAEAFASTTTSYDGLVDEYERRTEQVTDDYQSFRQAFIAAVEARDVVADMGCGPGRDARQFAVSGLAVIALDASQNMAARAREKGIRVVVADIRRPPFDEASFGGVWSSASLLHVPREQVTDTLRQWSRCLKNGGLLGLSTSVGEGEGWEDVPYEPGSQPMARSARRWFVHHPPDRMLERLSATGFEIVYSEERQGHRRWLQVLARKGN